jgi:hypothetical protein
MEQRHDRAIDERPNGIMILAKLEHLEKLRESGPRKKDRQYWEISKRDINQSNYNIWLCWMSIVIDYTKKRAERSAKVKK